MVMNLKHLAAAAVFSVTQCGLNLAHADDIKLEDTAQACHDTGNYALPEIPWVGEFIYKVTIAAKDARIKDVDVEAIRGPDSVSDRTIRKGLEAHIKQNYVCDVPDIQGSFYLRLNFKHEVPELEKKAAARRAAAAASATSAASSVAAEPASALVPASTKPAKICTNTGRPEVPQVNAKGTLEMQVIVEVTDGKIGVVDAKLTMGSKDAELNAKFIQAVERTIRNTYQCSGEHVFTQEFRFQLS